MMQSMWTRSSDPELFGETAAHLLLIALFYIYIRLTRLYLAVVVDLRMTSSVSK